MFRHAAESIKENSSKRFISKIEKDKFNNYENVLRTKEDSYSKSELDEKIKEISDVKYIEVSGEYISEQNTFSGSITDIEIFGNTYQNPSNLSDIQSVGELQKDGTCILTLKSCSKNLLGDIERGHINANTGIEENGAMTIIRNVGFIKCKPNTGYIFSCNSFDVGGGSIIYFYDKAFNFISYHGANVLQISPSNARYMRVRFRKTDSSVISDVEFSNIEAQLKESGTITDYNPQINSSVTLSLPCQLEKVDSVSDRLFRREEDGVWCIEKNVDSIETKNCTLKGVVEYTNTYLLYYNDLFINEFNGSGNVNNLMNTLGISYSFNTEDNEHLYIHEGRGDLCIYVNKSRFSNITNLESAKQYFTNPSFNILLKGVYRNPQIIELPLDTQIVLNSFYGTTHVFSENTTVDPTIKCKISKSLSGSIDSLVKKTNELSNRVEKVELLELGNGIKYESNKGYQVCPNTKKGFIHDIKIEGNTMVNLFDIGSLIFTPNDGGKLISYNNVSNKYRMGGKEITIFNTHPWTRMVVDINYIDTGAFSRSLILRGEDSSSTTLSSNEWVKAIYFNISESNYTNDKALHDIYITRNSLVLEGNYTNSDYFSSYFTGLKSAGDIEDMYLYSRDDNKNLYVGALEDGTYDVNTGLAQYYPGETRSTVMTPCEELTEYKISTFEDSNILVYFYDAGKSYITPVGVDSKTGIFKTPSNTRYFHFRYSTDKKNTNIVINKVSDKISNRTSICDNRKNIIIGDGNLITENFINQTGSSVGEKYPVMFKTAETRLRTNYIIPVKPSSVYYLNTNNKFKAGVIEFDNELIQIHESGWVSFNGDYKYKTKPTCKYIVLVFAIDDTTPITLEDIKGNVSLFEGSPNGIPILRALPSGVKDTIEKHVDGKYYYHKRCGFEIINGDAKNDWVIDSQSIQEHTDTIYLASSALLDYTDLNSRGHNNILCDRFISRPIWSIPPTTIRDYEGINVEGSATVFRDLRVRINKSRLSSVDKAGIDKWFNENPITVVYKLAQEEVYEVNNLDLESYDGETALFINAGPIHPKLSFSLSSYVGNYAKIINDRIRSLEDRFVKRTLSQNILQLNTTYSSDKLAFNLNINTCSTRYINEKDENVFNLILDILLSGKGNYNETKMETIIDFYTIIGKIDYEMADVLFGILYKEEEIVEDIEDFIE